MGGGYTVNKYKNKIKQKQGRPPVVTTEHSKTTNEDNKPLFFLTSIHMSNNFAISLTDVQEAAARIAVS